MTREEAIVIARQYNFDYIGQLKDGSGWAPRNESNAYLFYSGETVPEQRSEPRKEDYGVSHIILHNRFRCVRNIFDKTDRIDVCKIYIFMNSNMEYRIHITNYFDHPFEKYFKYMKNSFSSLEEAKQYVDNFINRILKLKAFL